MFRVKGATMTVTELSKLNDISILTAERALANLQRLGLVKGFVPNDPRAEITLTDKARPYRAEQRDQTSGADGVK
jgi:DNA-binding IclR family transcriptional regulator